MYQIISLQHGDKRVVVATLKNAGMALMNFRAAQNRFPRVIVVTPEGEEISGFELGRRYHEEERARYD
jgi:hypothetical protein